MSELVVELSSYQLTDKYLADNLPSNILHFLIQDSCYSSGDNRVIVSTWRPGGYRRNVFNLKVLEASYGIHGILCEKGKGLSPYYPVHRILCR